MLARGYDHNFVLDREDAADGELAFAARVTEPRHAGASWRCGPPNRASTSTPATSWTARSSGPAGSTYRQGDGLAIEPEHFSNSPNETLFPSTVLRPGQQYVSATEYRFSNLTS